jgi:hypothetical protein
LPIVRFVDNGGLELPSRVSVEVQDDDGVAMPLTAGTATVSEDVLSGNDVVPRIRRGAPLAGLNTTAHAGEFSPPFLLPDALKLAQSKVTDPQVAIAVTVSGPALGPGWAATLAAKIASSVMASGMTRGERRMTARHMRTQFVVGVHRSAAMRSLLSINKALGLLRHA